MKRKVIQIADSTQLISLPRKWALQHDIKKGDELEVDIDGSRIFVSTDKNPPSESVEVDVSTLDRTSIIYLVRALYKKGYDEIKISFKNPSTTYYRLKNEIDVSSVVHYEVARCPGLEIIEQKNNYFLLKAISTADPKELDSILRRTFILISDTCKDLITACKTNDARMLEQIQEKHDNVTRFINHSLRLINKRRDHGKNSHFLYNIVSLLDKILDIMKNSARDRLRYNKKITGDTGKILDLICDSYELYHELFYKFSLDKINRMNELKENIFNEIIQKSKNIPKEEILLLYDMHQSLELYRALTESRMAMEF